MNAGGIDRAIDAFIEGGMDFVQLRRVIEIQVGRNPARRVPARARLDALKEAGRMSQALYGILVEELERSAFGEVTVAAEYTEADPEEPPEPQAAKEIEPTLPDERSQPEAPAEPEPGPPPLAVAGEVLDGRYALESVLGRGGMSVVFRARDLHMPDDDPKARAVAVKVLTPEFAGRSDARAALAREAAYARRLSHPGLVRVYDVDVEGPLPFVVMELLEGERLRSLLVRRYPNALPPAEALPVIRAVASVLAHVHGAGLVHRDVKPANVFLAPEGQVRLLDLGLAGPQGEAPGNNGTMRARTPAYSPPEALAGEAPSPADDVYALGCVAYEMLAGRHPFGKLPGNEAASRGVSPTRIESLPAGQWQALRRSLEFNAGKRQPSAREFLDEFFAPGPAPAPARPWAAGGILAGLLAGLVLGWLAPPPAVVVSRFEAWVASDETARQAAPAGEAQPPVRGDESEPVAESTGGEAGPAVAPGDAVPDRTLAESAPAKGPAEAKTGEREAAGGTAPSQAPGRADAAPEEAPAAVPGQLAQVTPGPATPAPSRAQSRPESRSESGAESRTPAPAARRWLALPAVPGQVAEGDSALRVSLDRPAGFTGPLRVEWRTVPGTALSGDDYAGADWQELEAPAGAGALVLYVPIVADARAEPRESFFVEIRAARGGPTVGEPTRLEVFITDDD